uniref:Uncharacterized protein n=1 Tax=Acrobeloides nanus TaxID=290746 RepID=A0A914DBZ5_9BILA
MEPFGKKLEFSVKQFEQAYEYAFMNQAFHLVYIVMFLQIKEELSKKEKSIQEARNEINLLRVKHAMDDAVKILKRFTRNGLLKKHRNYIKLTKLSSIA